MYYSNTIIGYNNIWSYVKTCYGLWLLLYKLYSVYKLIYFIYYDYACLTPEALSAFTV